MFANRVEREREREKEREKRKKVEEEKEEVKPVRLWYLRYVFILFTSF